MEDCMVTLDDTEYLFGETFVPADTMQLAINQVEGFLLAKKLELLEITKCLKYDPQDWQDDSEKSNEINKFAGKAQGEPEPKYSIFTSTSGADEV